MSIEARPQRLVEPRKSIERELPFVNFSLNLVQHARVQRRFLREVNQRSALLVDSPYLRNAVRRYEKLWIPLLEHNRATKKLVAPLDIDYVFHCHQLNPVEHLEFLTRNLSDVDFGSRSCLCSSAEAVKAFEDTRLAWEDMYPTEPYQVTAKGVETFDGNFNSELLDACLRQASCYHQIKPSCYDDTGFLLRAVERYKQFLLLIKFNPGQFLTPTYDIDLMWHTHMRYTNIYASDMNRLFGFVLNHNDKDSDRSPGSKLSQGWSRTQKLWQQTYGASQRIPGTGYRGECDLKDNDSTLDSDFAKSYQYFSEFDSRDWSSRGEADKLSYSEKLRMKVFAAAWSLYLDLSYRAVPPNKVQKENATETKPGEMLKGSPAFVPHKLNVQVDRWELLARTPFLPVLLCVAIGRIVASPITALGDPPAATMEYTHEDMSNFDSYMVKWAKRQTVADSGPDAKPNHVREAVACGGGIAPVSGNDGGSCASCASCASCGGGGCGGCG